MATYRFKPFAAFTLFATLCFFTNANGSSVTLIVIPVLSEINIFDCLVI